jgi:hypothetical protein
MPPEEVSLFIFQIEYLVTFLATSIWCLQVCLGGRRASGTGLGLGKAVVLGGVSLGLIGPGALICTAWYWREAGVGLEGGKPTEELSRIN